MTSIPSHTIWSCLNRRFIISSLGSSLNWNRHLLSNNPRHRWCCYLSAKWKHHFADTNSDTQLIDLLQEICKEVSLKHTRIKQEPYSAPVHNNHKNHLQQNISQLQTNIQNLKDAINAPYIQYAAPLDTNPVALQQHWSKMKEDIKHLQQMKCPNVYPAPPGNYRSFWTKLGILHAHAQETYHLPEHPHIIRTIYTTIFLPPPPNIHGPHTLPIASPINIPNALAMDHISIDTILWTILTRQMSPTPILRDDHRAHPPIKLTASARLEGLIFLVKTKACCKEPPVPCIRHFIPQSYHDFDRYRLLYKPLGWTTILLNVLCPTATTYTVFSFRCRRQASYCTGYNLAIHCYQQRHISDATCYYKKCPFLCGIGNRIPPKLVDQPLNTNGIYNTYTPPIHASTSYHSHPHITVPPNHPYHGINTAPVTIPARTNTTMTIPCTLLCSGNYLYEPSAQNFADHPVHCTPVIINAANDNLSVDFINHSDRDVVVSKHTHVGAMEKVQESDQDNLSTNTTPEPVSQHALSKCLAHCDLLPSQRQLMHTLLQENSGVFGSSIADLSSTPLMLNP